MVSIRRRYADLKPFLIDLEGEHTPTGRKQENDSEKNIILGSVRDLAKGTL